MTRFLAAVSLTVALLGATAGGAQVIVTCPRAPAPPILDGNVTADEWVAAGRLGPFVLLHNQGLPREATDVRVMYDDDALYVAATMYDAETGKLRAEVTETDGDVYSDDCFELFIEVAGVTLSHVVVNSINTHFDEADGNRAAAVVWNSGVLVKDKAWSAELSIPFSGGGPPSEGSAWRIGAARNQTRLGELSSWNGFVDGFHEPARFGELRFGGGPVSFNLVDPGAMKLGRNTAALVVDNASPDLRQLKTNVRVHGRDRAGHFFAAAKFAALPGERTPLDVPYEVIQDGEGSLLFSVTDERGEAIYRSAAIPFRTPGVTAALYAVDAALAEASRRWAALPASSARDRYVEDLDALADEWRELSGFVGKRLTLSTAELKEVERALESLRDRTAELTTKLRAAGLTGAAPGSFAAVPVTSLVKVFPDGQPPLSATEARIEACRNEWEAFQIALVPLTEEPVSLTTQAGDLTGPSTAIPAEHVQVRLVGNVPAADHLTPGAEKRLWPDILTPGLTGAEPLELHPGETRVLWVSVAVPADAVPGEYTGAIRLADEAGFGAEVPVRLFVHHPVLPSPGEYHVSVGFWQAPQRIAQQYGLELWSTAHWEKLRGYLTDLALHGQKLATVTRGMVEWRMDENGQPLFLYTVLDRYIELCREVGIDEGIEYYSMYNGAGDTTLSWADAAGDAHSETANPGDERFDALWAAFLADFAQHLEAKGWLENAFICPTDEPRDGPSLPTLQRFARCAELVHAAHPGLKTTVAIDSLDSAQTLAPHIDRMVFKLRDDVYSRELAAAKRAEGGRVEAYICCHPDRPNTFITSPNLDSRVIGWLLFREELSGLLRWSYERWPPDPIGQPEGDGRYAAGDLFIVYPGSEGPFVSPRWEILRDGMEDYELLTQLRAAIETARAAERTAEADQAQAALDEALTRVVGPGPALAEFAQDPHELELARIKVLTTLDWLAG